MKPYLRNKKDKTFLDHWLLGDDLTRFLQPWEYGRLNTVERVLLAQRINGEPDKTGRHLKDMLSLLPPNVEQQLFLFNVGVDSGGLSTDDSTTGKFKALEELNKKLAPPESRPMEAPKSMAPGIPGRPLGGGGMGGGAAPGGKVITEGESLKRDLQRRRDGRSEAKDLKDAEEKAADKAEEFFEAGKKLREQTRQLYRQVDPTQEWAENNYYKRLIQQQIADLVPVGQFWVDYLKHDGKGPFLSKHLAEAGRNFTEIMFALSVIDLPFTAAKHEVKFENGHMTLTPASQLIAFHEEVRPADGPAGQLPILVSENFYRHGDRFREEGGEKLDKFVTDEFVIHVVYGGQVVVTNPTSSRQKLTVLVQLPVGAMPVANSQFTRSLPLDLEPYRTQTIDYFFYFPKPGKFTHFPAHVAKMEQFVAAAKTLAFNVVEKPTRLDKSSWEYVSQNGTNEEVLAFLNRENVRALNLDKIAFRMKDPPFFEAVTRLLTERHLYQPTLFSYGLFHADVATSRQYLQHADQLVAETGGPIDSPLLTVDPVARHQYEHLEYKPLVNARAHALGKRRQIVNERLLEQYHRTLKTLSYRRTLDDTDLMAVTYYLLLQDRIDEAQAAFARVNPDRVTTALQYDYCAAYLEMFNENPRKARSIAARYADHPVDRWRQAFGTIIAQLDEIEGKGPVLVDPLDRGQRQGVLAATEPGFEFTLENKAIQLNWQNLETVRINYYLMDVELLFSRNPFVQRSAGQFAAIKPNLTREVKLPAGESKLSIPLPDELVKKNVLVEITAAGKTRAGAYYATAMDVKFTENYGAVRVLDGAGGKPIPKVYVKVYARLADGSVKFHKDGYTDLRGRFDYVSVNTPERQPAERFAVLVLSDDRGALIRDLPPPQR